ncbi:MAG: thioredoxin family protein [Flavobacteriales bacterium]|nr:thioredoxin family protein [Flavobacteriales bacterium]HRH71351.1 thioredoxin family protein [Flavobacteriales bacterium]
MRTLFIALAFAPLALQAQSSGPKATTPKAGIQWLTIEEAQAKTKKVPKPLMVDVFTSWCGPCKMLEAKTFSDPRLAEYVNKHFYAVKFNAESGTPVTFKGQKLENPEFNPANTGGRNGTHQLTYTIANVEGRIAYPTVVYMDSDLNVLAPVQGYLTPDQMEPILNYFGEAHYKGKDYQTFIGGFKGKWTPQ